MKRLCVLITLIAGGLSAATQPVPKLNSLSPDWLQRGSTGQVTLTGENLSRVTQLIFSGDRGLSGVLSPPAQPAIKVEAVQGGISATLPNHDQQRIALITVATEANLGPREVRVASPDGVSNPLPLNLSPLPEVEEKVPNASTNPVQQIVLPVAVNGRIKQDAETDSYRFRARKGEHLIFDVHASRIGSPLDSSLALLDRSGKELARSEDANGLDSLIYFPDPDDGEYELQLRDFRYQGGADFRYRLLAGVMPYVTSAFPRGGQRGQQVTVELNGYNLDGARRVTLHLDAQAPLGPQEIRIRAPLGLSNPFLFDLGDAPEFTETEPNTTTNQANAVSVPVSINGRIGGDKDVDTFQFTSEQDQRLILQVEARRFGSPLDSLLTLKDAQGKVLQQNDDALGADARIDFDSFKKGQQYFISVQDLLGHGGEPFVYRLTIRQPQPDFSVKLFPDAVRIRRGGRAVLRGELAPLNGFNELVRVDFTDVPGGILCEPLWLSPSLPASGLLILFAAPDAPLGTVPITLSATTRLAGQVRTRAVEPWSKDRPVQQAFLTVLEPAPFTLEVSTLNVVLEQDQSATVEVMAQRRADFAGEIKLSAEGFSAGREPATRSLEIQELTLKGPETRGQVKLKARLDSELGTRTLVFRGETSLSGQPLTEYSRPIPVTITPVPFMLNPTAKRLSLTALPPSVQSAAGEAVFSVKVERRLGFTKEILLALDGLPEGITARVDPIPENGAEANVKLVATEKAPVGKEFSLVVTGAGSFNDRTYRQRTAPISLTVTAPGETTGILATQAGPTQK